MPRRASPRARRRTRARAPQALTPKEARRLQRRRVRRIVRYALIGFGAVVLILVLIGLVFPPVRRSGQGQAPPPEEAPGQAVPVITDRHHLQPGEPTPVYNTVPPTSGPHSAQAARCGIYQEPVPEVQQVHNLEHSFVLVQYRPGDPELAGRLEELVKAQPGFPNFLILAPYPKIPEPYKIALTAWGALDLLEGFDADRIERFIRYYRGRAGPEANPPPC